MHTICFNPDVSLAFRPLLSLPFTHTSYMFDEISERNQLIFSSRKCWCSCCCSYSAANITMCNRLTAISPSFLCKGLSQSTLIQWSLTKRLSFHGSNSGVSSFTDRNYNGQKLSSFSDRRKHRQRGFGQKRKKQFLGNVSDDYVNDVEVMLSLLTDEVGLDHICVSDRKKTNKKHIICDNKEKKNEDSGVVNNDPKCDDEQGKILEKKDTVKGNYGESVGASQNWREKSEKKLIEEVSLLSESRIKNCEEMSTEVSDTVKDIKEEKHQKTNHLNKTTVSSEKSEQISQVRDIHVTNSETLLVSHEHDHSCLEMKGPSDEMWHVSDTSDNISSLSENGKFDEWEEAYSIEDKKQKEDEMFMREALLEAKKAADVSEVPVGAVLVHRGKIIARGYNLVEELHDSTAHAEMICIRQASKNLKSWRLSDTTLYVTLEPCPMCAGAILQARIDTLVWGAPNKLLGADGSWIRLFPDGNEGKDVVSADKPPAPVHPFHHNMVVRRGVLAAECGGIMKHFFRLRRNKKTKPESPIPPQPESPIPPESESPIPTSSFTVSHNDSSFFSKMQHAFKIIFCL